MKKYLLVLLPVLLLILPAAPAYADITTGLVMELPFNEGSGTTANDISGTGNTGTLSTLTSGLPTWISPGIVWPFALNLNGTSAYVNIPTSTSLNPAAVTVSAWVRASSFTNAYNTIEIKADSAPRYYEYYIKSNGKLAVYISSSVGTTDYDGTGTNTLVTGTWYLVTFTYDSVGGIKGYVNGTLDGSAAANGALAGPTGQMEIGNDYENSPRMWHGDIDDVRVYNRALSSSDVAQLFLFSGLTTGHAQVVIQNAITSLMNGVWLIF